MSDKSIKNMSASVHSRLYTQAKKDQFVDMKSIQWKAFYKKLSQAHVPESFADIVVHIESFLIPIVRAINKGNKMPGEWKAPGPWQ